MFIYALSTYLFHVWLFLIRTKQSGDIEQNPRPKPNSCQSFCICHWNLKSITAHNFIKLSLLTFSAWCPLKGHMYLNKPAAQNCRFV